MVIRILTGKDVSDAVRYNEKKVEQGQADRIHIANYPNDEMAARNAQFRLDLLQQYARSNSGISKPSVHLAVAFHPTETLTRDRLISVGKAVMAGSGYGRQPYLMYQHHDTAHPHIHIVTVNVDAQGNRIADSFMKARLQRLRRELEQTFGLRRGENSVSVCNDGVGEGSTNGNNEIDTLSDRVNRTLRKFTFGSVESVRQYLSAQQIQMNTQAGRSGKGITFQWTDDSRSSSRSVKASALMRKPTHKNLTNLFASQASQHRAGCELLNGLLRQRLNNYSSITESDFKQSLRGVGITVVERAEGYLYVHSRAGIVAQEKELDSAFSRLAITQQFGEKTERITPQYEAVGQELTTPATRAVMQAKATPVVPANARLQSTNSMLPASLHPVETRAIEEKSVAVEQSVEVNKVPDTASVESTADHLLKKKKNKTRRLQRRM